MMSKWKISQFAMSMIIIITLAELILYGPAHAEYRQVSGSNNYGYDYDE